MFLLQALGTNWCNKTVPRQKTPDRFRFLLNMCQVRNLAFIGG
jgi:hypothetical protein